VYEERGGYAATDRLEAIMARLGLAGIPLDAPLQSLSGGEKTRAGLAALLSTEPSILLLDEPLNHLDLAAREQFEASLGTFNGTLLTVLHDRYAINRLATRVLELQGGTLTER
jgi:macrolide transport system ATP-binding/permease protein